MPRRRLQTQRTIADMRPILFRGGCNTWLDPLSMPTGSFSMIQNYRPTHPGFKQRAGQAHLHTTPYSTRKALSMYQFSKGKRTELHFFVQWSDNKIQEATSQPPAVVVGNFGTTVFTGSSGSIPAAWANLDDLLLFANGVDQHQIFAGLDNAVQAVNVYSSATALPLIPDSGKDFSMELTDSSTATTAVIGSVGTNAGDCVCVLCPIVPNRIGITVSSANAVASVMSVEYWKGSWQAVSTLVDGTANGGKSLAQSGYVTFDQPTDAIPSYMFGQSGFWIRLKFTVALSVTTALSEVTYGSTWQPLQNVWDGAMVPVVEARFYEKSTGQYFTYAGTSINVSSMVAGDDYIYFNSIDPLIGFYVDPSSNPSSTAGVSVNEVATWDGAAWQATSNLVDNTAGFTKAGWVTFSKYSSIQKTQFMTSYYSYWYRVKISGGNLSANTLLALYTMPYFDISELGLQGRCNCAWKNRAVLASTRDQYLYVSALHRPMVLNGDDFGTLDPGDGRSNIVVCMRPFKNELMVWQKEKGTQGGCFTLFEGYDPSTYGKLILSTQLGAMNSKSAVVVENVMVASETNDVIKTVVFVLSKYGVYMSDGRFCQMISDQIRDRFDPTNAANCIRAAYEEEMWIGYDSAYGVLRLGLVCGPTATTCNVFPIYDLEDHEWSFDVLAQNHASYCEVEAGSGNQAVLQIAGGIADGTIYRLNTGSTDDGTPIDAFATMEIDGGGLVINIRDMILSKSGTLTVTPYAYGVAQDTHTIP